MADVLARVFSALPHGLAWRGGLQDCRAAIRALCVDQTVVTIPSSMVDAVGRVAVLLGGVVFERLAEGIPAGSIESRSFVFGMDYRWIHPIHSCM